MKRTLIAIVALLCAFAALGDDLKPTVQVIPSGKIDVTFDDGFKDLAEGDQLTIEVDGVNIPMVVDSVTTVPQVGVVVEADAANPSQPEIALLREGTSTTAKLHFSEKIVGVVLEPEDSTMQTYKTYRRYTWSLGPAKKEKDATSSSGTGTTPAVAYAAAAAADTKTESNDAVRLQYSGEYASGAPFAHGGYQFLGTVSIDTTDQKDPSFIDNNRATAGVQATRLSFRNLLKQGHFGIEARASKAFHQDVRDVDGALTFGGWLPLIPAANFMNSDGDFLAPPLLFNLSYGYRNRRQTSDTFHGRVFEGTALYHVFAMNRINLDVNGTWTINQMSNRPATTPKTQRLYKATISYLQNPESGFTVLTTIEDGSAGVMLTKVRQYFLGLALSKINFSGGSK